MKSISAASLGSGMGQGTDVPFLDKGSESVTLNKSNYLNSPRMIASRINETNNTVTQNSPGDRSFNMTLTKLILELIHYLTIQHLVNMFLEKIL